MLIGVPKEIKEEEYRVSITPDGVSVLTKEGHRVLVEKRAGKGSGFSDNQYQKAGAQIVSAKKAWNSQLVVKVKEPQESEFNFLKEELILFTYLHLVSFPKLTKILQKKRVTAIDYATVQEKDQLPLLKPMSEVAGKISVLVGNHYLEKTQGGKGVLISQGNILIIGGGVAGENAAKVALGIGAKVTIFEIKKEKCRFLNEKFKQFQDRFQCLPPDENNLNALLRKTDLVVGAVLIPGAQAPKVITEKMVKSMEKGSVIVDVAIDQGGCIETSKPTSHKNPVFTKHGIIHYCVPNMPGIVPRTSTLALSKETLPYILKIANNNFEEIIKKEPGLAKGINIYQGKITNQQLARAFNKEYFDILKFQTKSSRF